MSRVVQRQFCSNVIEAVVDADAGLATGADHFLSFIARSVGAAIHAMAVCLGILLGIRRRQLCQNSLEKCKVRMSSRFRPCLHAFHPKTSREASQTRITAGSFLGFCVPCRPPTFPEIWASMGAQIGEPAKIHGGINLDLRGNSDGCEIGVLDRPRSPQSRAAAEALQARGRKRVVSGVMPTGAKYWRWKYRYGNKEKRIALGVFPEVSLAQAGQLRDEARAKLRGGIDPASQRKLEKLAVNLAAENTFAAIAREWLDTKSGEWVPEHTAKIRAWLENHVFPWIGDKPIGELEAPEVLSMLRKLVKRGTLNTAGRIRETVSAIFRYLCASSIPTGVS